jgi:hypothetical protein
MLSPKGRLEFGSKQENFQYVGQVTKPNRASLSGSHIGNRILLNKIPATLYSVVTISHKINTMTSFDTEARKDGSLPLPFTVSDQRLTSWDRYPLDE